MSVRRFWSLVLAGVAVPCGCSLPLEDLSAQLQNECAAGSDCGTDAVCAELDQRRTCVARAGDLASLVLEISPSNSTPRAGTSTLIAIDGITSGRNANGFIVSHDLQLEPLVTLKPGRVLFKSPLPEEQQGCVADDGSLAARVEFRPISPYKGLPLEQYTANTEPDGDSGGHSFTLSVPVGTYDIYVQFAEQRDHPECAFPPYFLPRQTIDGSHGVNIIVDKPPSVLEGTLTVGDGADDVSVQGSVLEVVEPNGGLVISRSLTIEQTSNVIEFSLPYYQLFEGSPIVRLRPPEGEIKPTVHWDLSGVGSSVSLTLADVQFQPVDWAGRVVFEEDGRIVPVAANLAIESTLLENLGGNAFYKTSVDSNPVTGEFELKLLPGEYRVIARPSTDLTKAIAEQHWIVKSTSLKAGHDIQVMKKPLLSGELQTANHEPLSGIPIVVTPPVPEAVSYLDKALGLDPYLPGQASGFPDESGNFSIPVDPGEFDFVAQPNSESGFPWFVRSRVVVPAAGAKLGTLVMPYPVVLEGLLLDESGTAMAEATIRAWWPLASSPSEGPPRGGASGDSIATVIQIAEAITDSSGHYTLFLPPSMAQ